MYGDALKIEVLSVWDTSWTSGGCAHVCLDSEEGELVANWTRVWRYANRPGGGGGGYYRWPLIWGLLLGETCISGGGCNYQCKEGSIAIGCVFQLKHNSACCYISTQGFPCTAVTYTRGACIVVINSSQPWPWALVKHKAQPFGSWNSQPTTLGMGYSFCICCMGQCVLCAMLTVHLNN